MKKLILLAAILMTGCGTAEWAAITGSKADGIVTLSYQRHKLVAPPEDDGYSIARHRCNAWGYVGAEAFGGVSVRCISQDLGGCNVYQVDKDFQCIDND